MTVLNRESVDYLTPRVESNQLHRDNLYALTLLTDVERVDESTEPRGRTTGNTICYVTGKLKVLAATADIPLITFPTPLLYPANVFRVLASAENGATPKVVQLQVNSTGVSYIGIPAVNEIIHLDSLSGYVGRG